jgi:ribosome-associated toxin RatA of RatAB toxin-antitoxin module
MNDPPVRSRWRLWRRRLAIAGWIVGGLVLVGLAWIYHLGSSLEADDVTPDNLNGNWTTRLVQYGERPAVRLYARFDVPVSALKDFVLDYERYPQRFPYVKSSQVLERTDQGARMDLVTRGFLSDIRERIRITYREEQDGWVASWTQEEGTLKFNDGEWEIRATSDGCFLRYTMSVAWGGWLPDSLSRGALRLLGRRIYRTIDKQVHQVDPAARGS